MRWRQAARYTATATAAVVGVALLVSAALDVTTRTERLVVRETTERMVPVPGPTTTVLEVRIVPGPAGRATEPTPAPTVTATKTASPKPAPPAPTLPVPCSDARAVCFARAVASSAREKCRELDVCPDPRGSGGLVAGLLASLGLSVGAYVVTSRAAGGT